jgi:hypothetical protein
MKPMVTIAGLAVARTIVGVVVGAAGAQRGKRSPYYGGGPGITFSANFPEG